MKTRLVISAAALLVAAAQAVAHDPLSGDFGRVDPRDVRVVSYNVHRDFIADAGTDGPFGRILVALAPDIVCFQEVAESVSDADLAARLDALLPASGGWRVHSGLATGIRTAIAARFPLILRRADTLPASSTRGVTIALADLPPEYPVDLYLLGVHLKCCGSPGGSEDASRQASADAITNWLADARGDARPAGDHVELATHTPALALGDFNLVGGPQPEATLVSGDIQDEGTYGADAPGDWDASSLLDVAPRDPFTGDDFTWQGNNNFPPGRLDRFFLTDSVAPRAAAFVLNTDTMTPAALAAAGLEAGDTLPGTTSDHLPIVLDLRLWAVACPGDLDRDGQVDLDDLLLVLSGFGAPGPDAPADVDGDGDVDLDDLLTLLAAFGATCG